MRILPPDISSKNLIERQFTSEQIIPQATTNLQVFGQNMALECGPNVCAKGLQGTAGPGITGNTL